MCGFGGPWGLLESNPCGSLRMPVLVHTLIAYTYAHLHADTHAHAVHGDPRTQPHTPVQPTPRSSPSPPPVRHPLILSK